MLEMDPSMQGLLMKEGVYFIAGAVIPSESAGARMKMSPSLDRKVLEY